MLFNIEKNDVLELIESLSYSYPILKAKGIQPLMPIAVITDNAWESRRIIDKLSPKNHVITGLSKSNTEEVVANSEVWPTLFWGANKNVPGLREFGKVESLTEAVRTGVCGEAMVTTLIVCIYEGHVPDAFQNGFFKIYLNDVSDSSDVDLDSFKRGLLKESALATGDFEQILDDIEGDDPMEACFKVAVNVACRINPEIRAERLHQVAEQLVRWEDERSDTDDLPELFLNILYRKAESGELSCYQLPNLETYQMKNSRRALYTDSKYFFTSEECFLWLVEELKAIFAIDVIKSRLADAGILAVSSGIYSTKMGVCTAYGEYKRLRMLKLDGSKLAKPGELSLDELCDLKAREQRRVKRYE